MRKHKIARSLEDIQNPPSGAKQEVETEVVVYGVVTHPVGLDQCHDKEHHVQLEGKFSTGTRCRVRQVAKDGGAAEYTFTVKQKNTTNQNEQGQLIESSIETNVPVDQQFFEMFKTVAERSISKMRYKFFSKEVTLTIRQEDGNTTEISIPEVVYEVDVFDRRTEDGPIYCKIDVEMDGVIAFMKKEYPQISDFKLNLTVSHLPFLPKELLLAHEDAARPHIKAIWDQVEERLNTSQA